MKAVRHICVVVCNTVAMMLPHEGYCRGVAGGCLLAQQQRYAQACHDPPRHHAAHCDMYSCLDLSVVPDCMVHPACTRV
jgi:hypothetical protein